jgi:hypothetical protein
MAAAGIVGWLLRYLHDRAACDDDPGAPCWHDPIEGLAQGWAQHSRTFGAEGETDMIIELGGRQAIVTGSTSGIGFAIARGLADPVRR